MSLRTKLLVGAFVIIAPLLAIIVYDYVSDYERRTNGLLDGQLQTAQAVAALVDDTFDGNVDVAWAIGETPLIKTLDPQSVRPYLVHLNAFFPDYDDIAVVDASGTCVGIAAAPMPCPSAVGRSYFDRVMATNGPAISEVLISRVTGIPIIVTAAPIRGEDGRPIGVVIIAQDIMAVPEKLATVGLREGQAIYLADTTGRLAFHTARPDLSWEERDVSSHPPVRSALEGIPFRSASTRGIFGDERLVATARTPKYGWVVGVSVPTQIALAPLQQDMQIKLLGYAVMIVVTLLIALFVAAYLLRPLRELAAHAIALGRGDIRRRVAIQTGDELQDLGEAFNRMADEVRRALRLREDFLTVASHELRTPLTIVKGYSQWLLPKEEDEAKRKAIQTIIRQADRMTELVQDMLEVSQIEAGRLELHKERFDLTALAGEVADRMQTLTEKHRLLSIAEAPVFVVADRERMAVALTNLVDNAIRYSPEGGDVEITVTQNEREAMVSVRDRGLGIPREVQPRVFEPFFQVYPAIAGFGGLGLGLFIARQIVERHEGRIGFESEPGKGSRFYFALPVAE